MTCLVCEHPADRHSSEPGVGCLETSDMGVCACVCLLPGTSQADQ